MKIQLLKKTILAVLFMAFVSAIYGQVTRIKGTVYDADTKEPLPFVNVVLDGTSVGTTTGFKGEFFIETRVPAQFIKASYMGYHIYKAPIRKGAYQTLEIYLKPETIQMQEVVVTPGENPAHIILRKIIKNKEKNDPKRFDKYQYRIYNKMELDINNITEDFKNKKAFKPFKFIFDYVDTSAITGKTFLPVFITETLSDYYYQRKPQKKKEVIIANNISGMEDDMISDFTGQMYLDFNIYDNFVPIMGKDMVSPIAKFGLVYYKYYLIDSAFRNNKWCYNISFKPKRKQEPAFTGNIWVNDTTFAIQSFKITLADGVNINFVEKFVAEQSYVNIDDSIWFPKKQELFVDFSITNKDYGFFGRKTTIYDSIVINPPLPKDFFSSQLAQETVLLDSASQYTTDDWDTMRPETLTQRESDIYHMVDSIQGLPIYNTIVNVINTIVTGYYVADPIEIGPYYTLMSYNPIEGTRLKFSCRTSNAFSTKVMFKGHVAYGTRDRAFKYGVGMLYMVNKNPRRDFGVDYKSDYEQLGVSSYAFLSDNILSSIFARKVNDKLTKVNDLTMFYEHEWFQGFSNKISFTDKVVYQSETVPFVYIDDVGDTIVHNSLGTLEVRLNTRFAYNEKFIMGEFLRHSLGTKYPIFNLTLTAGLQGILDGQFNYYKINMSVEHRFPVSPFGDFRYIVDAGKIFGEAPYPFLQLHEGNQTYAFDDYAFNLMNYYEFVSNEYVSVMLEQHFNGLFLNHIPLFRKLKWREIVETKILMGDLTQRATDYVAFPENLDDLSQPYMEAGFGVENIFKFFRVDALWRLTYLDKPDVLPFGIFAKMQVQF